MQAVCIMADRHPQKLAEVLRALYDAFWVQRRQMWHRDGFQAVFEEVLGAEIGHEIVQAVTFDRLTRGL